MEEVELGEMQERDDRALAVTVGETSGRWAAVFRTGDEELLESRPVRKRISSTFRPGLARGETSVWCIALG